jgi:hypothetical protein
MSSDRVGVAPKRARRPQGESGRRRSPLKLDPTVLLDRSLLDCDHLVFHLSELGRSLLVATDQECCRPEDNDRGRRRYGILRALAVLGAGERGGAG